MIADIYIASIDIIVLALILAGVFFLKNKPINTLYIILFTFPYKNFYIWVGTNLEIWKVLSIIFVVIYWPIWILSKNNGGRHYKYLIYFIFLIFYVLAMTVIHDLVIDPENKKIMIGGFLKNEGRIYIQIMFFLISVNLVFIVYNIVDSYKTALNCVRALLYGVVVLAGFGVIQFIVVKLTGINIFPIQGSDGISHSGYILNTVFRINSLAGEPKHMGMAMAIGIIIIILSRVNKLDLMKYEWVILIIMFLNLFFTYSTTGYAWLGVGLIIIFILYSLKNTRNIILSVLLLTMVSTFFFNISDLSRGTFEKQISKTSFEPQDEAVKSYFLENPLHAVTGTGLGNIHHYAEKYIPSFFPLFHDIPFKGNSGFYLLLGDYGLIGLFGLYFIILLVIIRNLNLANNLSKDKTEYKTSIFLSHFSLILSFLFLARYTELLFIFLGILFVLNKLLIDSEAVAYR